MRRLLSLALCTCLFAFTWITTASAFSRTEVGQRAHDFTLATSEGFPVQLSQILGRQTTVLVFWATWSPRSLEALQDLSALSAMYAGGDLAVVTINVDGAVEPPATARASEPRHSGVFSLADPNLSVYREYGVMAVPSLALLDASGTVTQVQAGYSDMGRQAFREAVMAVLGQREESPRRLAGLETKSAKHLRLGELLLRKGRAHDAIRQLSLAVAADPRNSDACRALADALQRSGRMEEADRVFAQLGNPLQQ